MFQNRSSDNAQKVFKKALKYGVPKQLHSDNDSTFRANEQTGKRKGNVIIRKKLEKVGLSKFLRELEDLKEMEKPKEQ